MGWGEPSERHACSFPERIPDPQIFHVGIQAKTEHDWVGSIIPTPSRRVTDAKELAKLPEEERVAFRLFWDDVDGLLAKVAGGK